MCIRDRLNIGAIGITNIQFVLPPQQNDEEPKIFVIEVNPRASRTVPFLSKVTGVPMVQIAVQAMLGRSISEQGWPTGLWPERNLVAIKAPVFSMSKLPEVDTYLGPEMKSTGEVMGIDFSYEGALTKALLASGNDLQPGIPILLSLSERTKEEALGLVRNLQAAECPLYATEGTSKFLSQLGIESTLVAKMQSGEHPNVADIVHDGTVSCVINTPEGKMSESLRDGFQIRRAAAAKNIPCFTSLDTAQVATEAMLTTAPFTIAQLSEYLENDN